MTTTFTWRPTYGPTVSHEPRVAEARFGDGYSARARVGINHDPKTYSLKFDSLDSTEGDAIMAFLRTAGGVDSFFWTDMEGVQGLYVCKTYSRTFDDEDKCSVSADFKQVFGG